MTFHKTCFAVLFGLCLAILPARVNGQDKPADPLSKIKWTKGPATASLSDIAELQVPAGYLFTDAAGTKKLLNMYGNPTSGTEVGLLMETNERWSVLFEF